MPCTLENLIRLGTPFHVFRYVFETDDLHFGLFERPEQPLLEAVVAMTTRLLGFVPEPPRNVLDLGSGFGATACKLAALGHTVVGIAPDPALIDHARALARRLGVASQTRFEPVGFEQVPWKVDVPFDAVLSQESLQYLPDLPDTFRHLAAITTPRARIVLADQVLRRPLAPGIVPFHPPDAILAAAQSAGFRLHHREDLTARAQPSIPRAMVELRRRRDDVVEFFRQHRPGVEREIDDILMSGAREIEWFERGDIGYELMVFDRPSAD